MVDRGEDGEGGQDGKGETTNENEDEDEMGRDETGKQKQRRAISRTKQRCEECEVVMRSEWKGCKGKERNGTNERE